jgi:outer membrane usher protein
MSRQRLWWPLFAVPGYRAQLDAARQALELEVLAEAFAPTALGAAPAAPQALTEPMAAAFVNYDISWTEARGAGTAQSDRGLLTEAGLTGPAGVLLSTQVLRWQRARGTEGVTDSRRIETHWTRDWPQHELTLRVGDSWTRASTWGRQAAFGGVQLGTQRALWRPGAGMARPVLSGSALTPSTVELYVNESLRQTVQVPPGPFTLENNAPLAGAGEAEPAVDQTGHAVEVAQHAVAHRGARVVGVHPLAGEHRPGHRRGEWIAQLVPEQSGQALGGDGVHTITLARGRWPSS